MEAAKTKMRRGGQHGASHERLCSLLLLALLFVGCKTDTKAPRKSENASPAVDRFGLDAEQAALPVLSVGSRQIRLDTFAGLLGPRPRERGLPPEPQRREEFLDEQLQLELLSVQAQHAGLMESPDIVALQDRNMVQLLLEDLTAKQPPIKAAEVRAFYDSHPEQFVVPPRVQALHIQVGSDKEARAIIAELGEKVDAEAFMDLARQRSQERYTASRGGRLAMLSKPNTDSKTPKPDAVTSATAPPKPPEELVAALFAEPEHQGLYPEPIRSSLGYHVALVLKRLPQEKIQFKHAQRELKQKLIQRRNQAELDALLDKLKKQAAIKVNAKAQASAF